MADLKLQNINKIYDNNVQAVFDFNLDVKDGEFIVLVGPSGCGKSTTLRMVAGLEDISNGELFIDDKNVTNQAPKNRDIAMVFQNYALYAHMTVYENMAFSLMMRREDEDEIHKKVMAVAESLDLTEQLGKKPKQMSGGQRQRVALGRAIVRNPKVFLFDEPLSNLDAKLRGSMRREIKLLHKRLDATIIYVTHDQIEALTLADRIVVMSDGRVQQIGKPTELYEHPANLFVASFIGLPPMNFIEVSVESHESLKFDGITIPISEEDGAVLKDHVGKNIILGIRPEDIVPFEMLSALSEKNVESIALVVNGPVTSDAKKDYAGEALLQGAVPEEKIHNEMIGKTTGKRKSLPLSVNINENLGHYTLLHGVLGRKRITAKIKSWCNYKQGDVVEVGFMPGKSHYFDKETTMSLRPQKKEG